MPTDLRFVFDSNVIVSALLLKHSVSRRAFDKALQEGRLLLSLPVIEELNRVLGRDAFTRYVLAEERRQFLIALVRAATLIDVTETVTVCRDPKDDKFFELAVSGRATCIVSGDKDLLSLHPFRGIPILNPAAFLTFGVTAQKQGKNGH
jgi:putative PIN family toxin of toxin-antitoxin system